MKRQGSASWRAEVAARSSVGLSVQKARQFSLLAAPRTDDTPLGRGVHRDAVAARIVSSLLFAQCVGTIAGSRRHRDDAFQDGEELENRLGGDKGPRKREGLGAWPGEMEALVHSRSLLVPGACAGLGGSPLCRGSGSTQLLPLPRLCASSRSSA